MALPKIKTPTEGYIIEYDWAIDLAREQNSVFWTEEEIEVDKDLHDIRTNFTEAEEWATTYLLKLFTFYELFAGEDYWGGRVMKTFPRPDIQRMANCFSFFELNVHSPFYNRLNEVLGLDTKEFYESYKNEKVLVERMEFIDSYINHKDDLISLGVFSIVEGAILYSSFAFLKHFQAEGKNKLVNVTAGINFSVRDENLHSIGGAALYETLKEELQPLKSKEYFVGVEQEILKAAKALFEHEEQIIKNIFSKGKIPGITDLQLTNFVQSRVDECLNNLSIEPLYKPTYNPVAKWFYKNINGAKFHDFFYKQGNEYARDWVESKFIWPSKEENEVNLRTT